MFGALLGLTVSTDASTSVAASTQVNDVIRVSTGTLSETVADDSKFTKSGGWEKIMADCIHIRAFVLNNESKRFTDI